MEQLNQKCNFRSFERSVASDDKSCLRLQERLKDMSVFGGFLLFGSRKARFQMRVMPHNEDLRCRVKGSSNFGGGAQRAECAAGRDGGT
eukprot:4101944-Amphidinium_carterae.1